MTTTDTDDYRPKNHFESNQICFSSSLGKVFQLPEFQAKLFFDANLRGCFSERQPLKMLDLSYMQSSFCFG